MSIIYAGKRLTEKGRKLTLLEAADIKSMKHQGLGCSQVARLYGVTPSLVCQIWAGTAWRDCRRKAAFLLKKRA